MSPEERQMLKRSVDLAEDNNKALHAIRRSIRLGHIMSVVYWIFIIGSAVGAYYFVQPYLDGLVKAYSGAKSSIGDGSGFKALFDGLKQASK